MNIFEAKEFLDTCKRSETRDRAFGDTEIIWVLNHKNVATGYFSSDEGQVWIDDLFSPGKTAFFEGKEAKNLQDCGTLDEVWRYEAMDVTGMSYLDLR